MTVLLILGGVAAVFFVVTCFGYSCQMGDARFSLLSWIDCVEVPSCLPGWGMSLRVKGRILSGVVDESASRWYFHLACLITLF